MLTEDKTRVYKLARELDLDSKDLLDLCRRNGLVLKNQLSSLDPEQRDAIVEWVKRGGSARAASAPKTDKQKVRTIQRTPSPTFSDRIISIQQEFQPAESHVEIVPPPKQDPTQESSESEKNSGIEFLLDVGAEFDLEQLQIIQNLSEIDPTSALFTIRKVTERFCKLITGGSDKESLKSRITTIGNKGILGQVGIAYLEQIREVCNKAVHHSSDPFDNEFRILHVNHACISLGLAIQEYIARRSAERS